MPVLFAFVLLKSMRESMTVFSVFQTPPVTTYLHFSACFFFSLRKEPINVTSVAKRLMRILL